MYGLDKCQFHASKEEKKKSEEYRETVWRGNPDGKGEVDFDLEAPEIPKDAAGFAQAVLSSQEFEQYVMIGIVKRDIPPTVLLRLMDYAEKWGRPSDRIEHTGKNGDPMVSEIRRVIVHPQEETQEQTPTMESVELQGEELDVPLIPMQPRRMH